MARPVRVLVGTPASGGLFYAQYLKSILTTQEGIFVDKLNPNVPHIDMLLYTLANESLISRGRSHIAAVALYGKFDKLFFIDADQGFEYSDFKKLVFSDKLIIAGVTPLKIPNIHLNFEPMKRDKDLIINGERSPESLYNLRKHYGQDEVQVRFVGTGMMCIDVAKVLMPLTEVAEPYRYPHTQTGALITHWNLFPTNPINRHATSEDYGFLHLARKIGIEPWINTTVHASHTGNHTFRIPPEEVPA